MKYVVTGGAGFLGSHLVDRLLDEGNEVVVVDDFSEGKLTNLKMTQPKLRVYYESILDEMDNLFNRADVVFHLAALTRPQESIINPEKTNNVNIQGTLNVLKKSYEHGVKRVVFVSSSSLYGTQDILPTPETATPRPMSPYALSKLVGEQYCKLFGEMYGLESNYIRPFNVYGSRQNPEGGYAAAVPKFIDLLGKGETPWITGDGKQARDFVYIDDVIELMILASECKEHGEIFNAGSGKNISINDLYKKIAKIMNKDIKPDYIAPVFEPAETLCDISKCENVLGWKPKIKLDEGLGRMILK